MPNKKARQDALEMLMRRSANNAIKNEAQRGNGRASGTTQTVTANNRSKYTTTQPRTGGGVTW